MKNKEHLPILCVGPVIGGFQVILTIIGVILCCTDSFWGLSVFECKF